MAKWKRIVGSEDDDFLDNDDDDNSGADRIKAGDGDDIAFGGEGDDSLRGEAGFDVLFGEDGDDRAFGGTQSDFVFGGDGADLLFGDDGFDAAKGVDLAADRLKGGRGADILVQGDGNDTMTGGAGGDEFYFRWNDPLTALAAGTGAAFTSITDFNAKKDVLTFDAVGLGEDQPGANFVNGSGDTAVPGQPATFFSGATAASNGEAVMVLTDQAFATGAAAVAAAQNEAAGDFVLYFNSTVGVASLLYVTGPDAARSIARFTDIDSLAELGSEGFAADDFLFV